MNMMRDHLKLYVLIGIFMTALLLLLYLLKPTELEKAKVPEIQPHIQVENPVINDIDIKIPIEEQEKRIEDQTQQQLSKQRDMLYGYLGELSFQMIEGQKPDVRKIIEMMILQNKLVKAGWIDKQEAINYLDFLYPIFPELQQELNELKAELNEAAS